ncbi:hypothetical protein CAPTEDRAFT_194071, partial [Capitella teleta]
MKPIVDRCDRGGCIKVCIISFSHFCRYVKPTLRKVNVIITRSGCAKLNWSGVTIVTPVLDRLDMELCAVNHDSNKKLASFLKSLKAKFDRFLSEMIVVGFSGGKYDLNVIKKQLLGAFAALNEKVIFCYNLKILDIVNYLAPGFSYAKYLKAFNCSVMKGYFPYEWLDSYDKLAETSLPPKSAFSVETPSLTHSSSVIEGNNRRTYLRECRLQVIAIWECEWRDLKKEDA